MSLDQHKSPTNSDEERGPRMYLCVRPSQPENRHGAFAAEILRTEGLSSFCVHDLDSDGLPSLRAGDIAVLTRCFLRKAEIDRLALAVEKGASLVCLHPQRLLLERFGWETETRVEYPGWVRVRKGWSGEGKDLQTHVPISRYTAGGNASEWACVADIIAANEVGTPDVGKNPHPAVAWGRCGEGAVGAFFYDVSKAVARIRFGNPDLASLETLGFRWYWPHAGDLFAGHVDERVLSLPQADYHCQMLADVVTRVCSYPLGRLWYYPEARQRSVAVFQSDGDSSELSEFEALSECLLDHEGTGTFYLMKNTKLGVEDVERLRRQGHTFGPHVFGVDGKDELYFRFPEALKEEVALFRERFGTCSRTIQSHYAPWMGYMSWVGDHMAEGYRMLFAHMSVPGHCHNGFMCGSGRALRFSDSDGTCYDCWQQPVISYDDSSLEEYLGAHAEEAIAKFGAVLDGAVSDSYTVIGMLSHPVSFVKYSRNYTEGCLDLLQANGVPIWNGDEWCDFLYRRDAVQMSCKSVGADHASWGVSRLQGRMVLLFPVQDEDGDDAKVTVDGEVCEEVDVVRRWGRLHVAVGLDGGDGNVDIDVAVRW